MVDQTLVDNFHRDGFVLVPGMLSKEEAADLRRECHELVARLQKKQSVNATWGAAKELEGGKDAVLLHCHDVQFQSAAVTRLISDPRFTDYAAALIGSENVELHHNKMFIKPPEKGAPFPMHQDKPYFPFERDTMIAGVFFFDDSPIEKGCIRFVPGSHKLGDLPHLTDGGYHLSFDEYPVESATPVPAKAGDCVFFHYNCIHGSGVNVSDEARTTLLVQVRDPEDVPVIKTHESRGQGMILRGIAPTPPDQKW